MLLPFPALTPRVLSSDAPACQPCPWPVNRLTPEQALPVTRTIAECSRAHARCQELAQAHPSWPGSRVRAQVARELSLSTVTLRYLLRRTEILYLNNTDGVIKEI